MKRPSLFHTDWLTLDRFVQASAYYFKQWDEFHMPFHTHDSVEIMYVISGVCQVEFAGEESISSKGVILKKGEFIILNANYKHRLIVDRATPCRMLNIEFKAGNERSVLPSMKVLAEQNDELYELFQATANYLVLRDSDEMYHTLKKLVLELDSQEKNNSGTMLDLLFAQLLIQIARIYRYSFYGGTVQHDIYVSKSITFMHHNYDRSIQVKDIAEAVNLHHGYLHRLFRSQTGQSLTEYLTELRLAKAKMLLSQTDVPIQDICDYIGVGSREYFHALFKKHMNLTPVQYRTQMNSLQLNDESDYIDYK